MLVFLRLCPVWHFLTAFFSARQQSALYAIARPSVCLSRGWVSKNRLVIIMQFSPYSNPILLVFARQVSSRNSNWFPWSGRHKQRWGGGKQATFLALFINISKTVRDNVYSYYVDVVGLSSAMGLQSKYRARAKWRFSTSIRENISQTVSIGLIRPWLGTTILVISRKSHMVDLLGLFLLQELIRALLSRAYLCVS